MPARLSTTLFARWLPMRLRVEQLESRSLPAVLDLAGGVLSFTNGAGEVSNVTVSVASNVYTVKDSANLITLSPGAVASGWRGSGTHQVSGTATPIASLDFDIDDGTLNIRSIADPIIVDGGSGSLAVNLGSTAPTPAGNLNGLSAGVTVNAGANTSLMVGDLTGPALPGGVTIDATSITGMTPTPIALSGWFAAITIYGPVGQGTVYTDNGAPTNSLTVS